MSVFKNGKYYHYEFVLNGRRRRGSTGTDSKPQAIAEERRQRERLEKSYSQVIEEEAREQRGKPSGKLPTNFWSITHRNTNPRSTPSMPSDT
jgi:hypothetical protein